MRRHSDEDNGEGGGGGRGCLWAGRRSAVGWRAQIIFGAPSQNPEKFPSFFVESRSIAAAAAAGSYY